MKIQHHTVIGLYYIIIGLLIMSAFKIVVSAFAIATDCYDGTIFYVWQVNNVFVCIENALTNHETRITILENLPPGSGNATVLNDLGDVVIASPANNDILKFNGNTWINSVGGGGSETTQCINVGNSILIIKNSTSGNCYVKSLVSGNGITVSNGTDTITITNTLPESTVCTNLGSLGEGIYSSGNCDFKKLLAGTGITLSSNGTRITIDNSLPDNTTCANVGSGAEIYKDGECNFRELTNGTNTIIKQNANDISISAYQTGQEVGQTYLSLTKTNLPTTYTDIYTATFDEEDIMRIDFRNASYFDITYMWDFVGAGTDQVRWVDSANNANVLWEDSAFSADKDAGASGWIAIPSWANNVFTIEWQGKSSNGTNDPIAKGYRIDIK